MDQLGVPRILASCFRYTLIGIIAFGLAGLALAIAGFFEPAIAIALSVALAVAMLRISRPMLHDSRPQTQETKWCAVLAAAVVLLAGIFHGVHHGEHLAIDRDPAITINAAKWLSETGSLEVDIEDGPFTAHTELVAKTEGMSETSSGKLQFQGDHFLTVLLAGANWLGGDTLMFVVPALIAGLALLGVYILLAVKTSPLASLVVMTALGFGLPFTALARDAYTEIPLLLVVSGVLWLTPNTRPPSAREASLIGLALGAMLTIRLDAALLLLGWPIIIAGWRTPGHGRIDRRVVWILVAGFLPGATIAALDLALRNRHYMQTHDSRIIAMWVGVLVSVIVTISYLALLGEQRFGREARLSHKLLRRAAASGFIAISVYAWLGRPSLNIVHKAPKTVIAALQKLNGLPIDPTRRYTELTLEFQQWYYGIGVVAAGIIGIALAILVPTIGRNVKNAALMIAPMSIVYLVHPNAVPDQIWVMRRYLVGATLMLLFGVAVLLTALLRNRSYGRPVAIGLCVALATGVLLPTALVTKPVRYAADQRGHLAGIEKACEVLGPKAAVIVPAVRDANSLFKQVPQPLRAWCSAEVAVANARIEASEAKGLAREWASLDRILFVVANSPEQISAICAESELATIEISNQHLLQQTLIGPPRRYDTERLDLVIGRVDDCSLVDPQAAT